MYDGFLIFLVNRIIVDIVYLKFKTFVVGARVKVLDDYKVFDYFVWNVV